MDRISGLNAIQIVKELQKYPKYQNKTQKKIKEEFDNVFALRMELRKLENETNIVWLKGLSYTEDELVKMVNYYKDHTIIPPKLNDDIYKEILLRSSPDAIKNLSLSNKNIYNICKNLNFWTDKFIYDNIPHLNIIHNHEYKGRILYVNTKMKKLPNNVNKWIIAYRKMLKYHALALKLEYNIINNKKYKRFTWDIDVSYMLWLPNNILDIIIRHYKRNDIDIFFSFENDNYYILLISVKEKKNVIISKNIITQEEFIYYLTLLYYYHNPGDVNISDKNGICFRSIKTEHLIRNTEDVFY